MFKISFSYLNKTYTATVQKNIQAPVEFVVFDIAPAILYLPNKMVFQSKRETDQLIYQSFSDKSAALLTTIGESIFTACYQQKIKVHS